MQPESHGKMKPRRKRPWPLGGWPGIGTAACWTARVIVAAVVCLAGWCVAAAAMTGSVQVASGGGLRMTLDSRWLDGSGYRPARIQFTPTAPVTTDRHLTVEILLRSRPRGDHDLRVTQDIEIPAGSGPVMTTVATPQMDQGHAYTVNVREDGVLVSGLSLGSTPGGPMYFPQHLLVFLPAILFVGDRAVDTSRLAAALPVEEYHRYHPPITSSFVDADGRLPTAAQMSAGDLPQRWIDYTNLDVVCLSLDELAGLAESRPGAFRAVVDWVASGGNLWVYGVGDRFRRIGKLEDLVGLAPASRDDASKPGVLPPLKKPHFVLRDLQMGLVVALAPDDPFPGTAQQWNWVLGAMGPERWQWPQRHGLSMVQENEGFWDFLIPGVGLVPAVQFGVLITLFVLAIGPLNYFLLRRWKRLHLLVVTVPLGAAAVTLALFVYALLADGLGTRVRVRSVTHLDQRAGRAVCWSRMSYYAGLSPSGGLRFPAEAAVYPLEALSAAAAWNQPPQRRELAWEDDQWLQSGWLRARTPTQFVTVRCRPSDRGLTIAPIEGDANRVHVTNRLAAPIRQLLVRAADGTCYWAEGVEEDATVRATRIKLADAMLRLGATYYENRPRLPAGMHSGTFQTSYQRRWPRSKRWKSEQPPSPWTSRLEGSLQMLQLYPPPSARVPPNWQRLPRRTTGRLEPQPGTYIATVEESPEVATGIPSARQEAGYHVILGEF